ncbi:MAG: tetratricopeptide repeat protein, partial [Gemmatimonadota bacterium]|nr:tetratricopeptide repeat protein [Gemmatimonadota bacterium]
ALASEHAEVTGSLDHHLDEHEGDLGTVVGTELSELAPDDADTHFDLGMAFKQMGQYKKAISELEVAARNAEKRPEALRFIALCNLEQGNPQSAVEHLGQALTSPMLNSAARIGLHYDLATAFEQLGDTPRAIAELRAILDAGASDFLDVQARLTRLGG